MLAHNSQNVWAPNAWLGDAHWRWRLFKHDHLTRRAERLAWWVAENLPRRLRYWVVITAAADASRVNPHQEVPTITWGDMAKVLEKR